MTWFFDIFCPHLPKSGDPGLTPQDAMQMLGSDCRGGQGWLNVEADWLEIREIKLWVSEAVWRKCWFCTMGPAWHASLCAKSTAAIICIFHVHVDIRLKKTFKLHKFYTTFTASLCDPRTLVKASHAAGAFGFPGPWLQVPAKEKISYI